MKKLAQNDVDVTFFNLILPHQHEPGTAHPDVEFERGARIGALVERAAINRRGRVARGAQRGQPAGQRSLDSTARASEPTGDQVNDDA